jgi:general secretion pathway protein M
MPGPLLGLSPPILAAIISILLLLPARCWYLSRADDLALQRQEASRIAAMSQHIPELRRHLAALQAATRGKQLFLAGDGDAIAGANLQSAIEALAGRSGASLESTTLLPAESVNGLSEIALSVNLKATWTALVDLLSAIDLAQPRMIVSDLSIINSEQVPEAARDIPLQIDFTVTAFRTGPN